MSKKNMFFEEDQEKVQQTRRSAEGKGNYDTWTPEEGENNIRIMPMWAKGKSFIREFYSHGVYEYDEFKLYVCPQKEGVGKCLICDVAKKFFDGTPQQVAVAKKIYAKKNFVVNMIDRAKPADGVQVYRFGKKVSLAILEAFPQPPAVSDLGNVLHPEEGRDFKVKRTGKGELTQYDGSRWAGSTSAIEYDLDDFADLDEWVASRIASVEQQKAVVSGYLNVEDDPTPAKTQEYDPTEKDGNPVEEEAVSEEKTEAPEPPADAEEKAQSVQERVAALKAKLGK